MRLPLDLYCDPAIRPVQPAVHLFSARLDDSRVDSVGDRRPENRFGRLQVVSQLCFKLFQRELKLPNTYFD
jgi:hypothetical protein